MPTASVTDFHDIGSLGEDIRRHILSNLGNDLYPPDPFRSFSGLAYAIRDRLIRLWLATQASYYDSMTKRVYYLSMEFLPGRFLMNYITNLGMEDGCRQAASDLGYALEDLAEEERDAGLGNGGLGRLASCYMDSLATLRIPGYGYGILYDYGLFHQTIVDGWQEERADNWRRHGSPWVIDRVEHLYPVRFYGRSEPYRDNKGALRYRWVEADTVMAMPCDILIPAHGGAHVTNMRLWTAASSQEFSLRDFNQGDFVGAMQAKILSENISKVLYPNDEPIAGKELRLKQQYFLVAATLRDIVRRHKKSGPSFDGFADQVAIQLNDTHPTIAIAELMRILVDEEFLAWDAAWDICRHTFAYTNHTVLPEALETWSADLMGRVLPRHLEIIAEIDRRFLAEVAARHPGETGRLSRMAIIDRTSGRVRMAHLAIVGSHAVNGVARLHSDILKDRVFKDFDAFYPGKFTNVTNGITPRRWLLQTNPTLSRLITDHIGPDWATDLTRLTDLVPLAGDPAFRQAWRLAKRDNKKRLARYVLRKTGIGINPDTLFDVQFKRMHEYKRQLLNVLHVVTLYNRLRRDPALPVPPRTVLIGGKAAPGYFMAKRIIRLVTAVAETVNADDAIRGRLRMVFLPNYCVSQAEKVIPAADLSQQISTAGMEASGTGNMKFALNGALTIGTLDGANIEIMEQVGRENIFIFGLTTPEVEAARAGGTPPRRRVAADPELAEALDMIGRGFFHPADPGLFTPILDSLLDHGDYYCVTADYRACLDAQDAVNALYLDPDAWSRASILNTANMGYFSSDRAVLEYARNIWNIEPLGE
ncbi:glycogen/starch/alpha-glucan phosphorylase [Solidesulfovibrio carbinoliphilus subsp. oakridgensis]|uniref:Alpha-1,4 glucan phosphorylase n=1 Tax=Solidesulfovibrio carbinoliphilus subsp. oakridgensis TaxID=694327 RepID=G7QAZ8_9BACT|nr:glycogen/starch/alpha-glucan phosphorylase [Solidesulfovibrio carbinoliphilus]EHJ48339.1 glycogen/starch/alpha-glucan phosphorylase [Solidesulfovibrio carbinoliphilus subsp. oakridgensis]